MHRTAAGICWPRSATVGCLTVSTPLLHGQFPAEQGDDAIVDCDLVPAGKFRNGAARHWCRTHQHYWGVKADLASLANHGAARCARHAEAMAYVLDPPRIDLAALDATPLPVRCAALVLQPDPRTPLFAARDIAQINITPPAVQAMASALRAGHPTGCVDCARCGHPHLDLGDFSARAHRRHTCGHCGHDATHSAAAIVSNPLFPLLAHYGGGLHTALSSVTGLLVL